LYSLGDQGCDEWRFLDMMFVSYTPLDAVGTEVGLMLLTKMVNSIWHGNFFGAAILSVIVFLSLAKIAMDAIIEHKYETALKEFARLAIVVVLFTTIGSATIFSMNIINFGYAYEAAQNGSTVVGNVLNAASGLINKVTGNNITGYTYNVSNPTSASIQAYGVPLMAEIYAIPSNLAYQISSIMLNPQKNATIDVSNMILDPKNLILNALNSMTRASRNPGEIYKAFAKCYDQQAYNSLSDLQGNGMSCDDFNKMWAESAQNIVDQIKQKGNVDPSALKPDENVINAIKQGYIQNNNSLKSEYLGNELTHIEEAAKNAQNLYATLGITGGTQPDTSLGNKAMNNIQAATGKVAETIALALSTVLSLKEFLEDMMITVQEYAIAIMFILLPLVVVVGLLPIFGNNYKLILKYAFSFFLIKLWIPIYWFVYVVMVNISAILMASVTPIHNGIHYIDSGIQYAITTVVGNSAYAQAAPQPTPAQPPPPTPAGPQPPPPTPANQPIVTTGSPISMSGQQIVSTANAMEAAAVANKFSAFNNILLTFFAVAIPSVLGSAATYLVGRGTMEAGVAAVGEAAMFTKQLFTAGAGIATKAVGKAAGKGLKAAGGAIKNAPSAIKNAPGEIRDFWKNRQLTKELYDSVHVGRSAKALDVKLKRSNREAIIDAAANGNILVQDKEGGISAFYDKNYRLRAIRRKDGTFVDANSLSAEDRAKYDLDVDKGFGVIDTRTGNFVNAGFSRRTAEVTPMGNAFGNDRIGKITNKEMLKKLNKMLQ